MTAGRPERTAPITCPGCGTTNTGRMEVGSTAEVRVDGDVSVCFYCSALGIYVGTPPHALRKPTEEELADLKADPHVQKLLVDLTLFRMAEGTQP